MEFPKLKNPFAGIQTRFQDAVQTLQSSFNSIFATQQLASSSSSSPLWARIPKPSNRTVPLAISPTAAVKDSVVEERLAGVPVYALSNADEEFVLVSGKRSGKSMGFFCFKEEDAEAMLEQLKAMDSGMRDGSRVVAVALNKVFQLKVEGVAFRLIPESSQVANAIKEKQKRGEPVEDFEGVPIFQSRSLVLRSQNKRYRPAFFRKEDLEHSLLRASHDQRQLNPSLRKGDLQVGVLEEIIDAMKESSPSKWDDVVFIPPGFDVSTGVSQED